MLVLLFITKPSDQTYIDQVKDKVNTQINNTNQNRFMKAVEEIGADVGSNYAFRIEDNLLYKTIYVKGTNQEVGIGCIGMIFLTSN